MRTAEDMRGNALQPVIDPVTGYDAASPVRNQGYPYWWLYNPEAFARLRAFRESAGLEVDDMIEDLPQSVEALRQSEASIPVRPKKRAIRRSEARSRHGRRVIRRQRKSMEDVWDQIESKVVRHVRTPAGVRRFKQPVGSVIVRDGDSPLTGLQAVANDFAGWEKLHGTDGRDYYIGKDPEKAGNWVAVDHQDEVIVEGSKEEDVYRALDKFVREGEDVSRDKRVQTDKNVVPAKGQPPLGVGDVVRKTPDGADWYVVSASDNDPNFKGRWVYSLAKNPNGRPGNAAYTDESLYVVRRTKPSTDEDVLKPGKDDRRALNALLTTQKQKDYAKKFFDAIEEGDKDKIGNFAYLIMNEGAKDGYKQGAVEKIQFWLKQTGAKAIGIRKMSARERADRLRKKKDGPAIPTAEKGKWTRNLKRGKSEYPGFQKYTGADDRAYYVQRDETSQEYVAYDANDNEVVSGVTQDELLERLSIFEERSAARGDIERRRREAEAATLKDLMAVSTRLATAVQEGDWPGFSRVLSLIDDDMFGSFANKYGNAKGEPNNSILLQTRAVHEEMKRRGWQKNPVYEKVGTRIYEAQKIVFGKQVDASKFDDDIKKRLHYELELGNAHVVSRVLRTGNIKWLPKRRSVTPESKSLLQRVSWIQEKVVRHVRTPGGARHYGQPIGSIIVRDGAEPLKHLTAIDSDYEGWDKVRGSDGSDYYIGHDPDKEKWWVAVDGTDEVVTEGAKEEQVYRDLDKHVGGKSSAGTTKKPAGKGKRADARVGAKWEGDTLVLPSGKRVLTPKGFRPATDEEWEHYKVAPRSHMFYVRDGDSKFNSIGFRIDLKENRQTVMPSDHADKAKADDFQRMKVVMRKMPQLDRKLESANLDKDDIATVVYLMRLTGMRVGNEKSAAGGGTRNAGEATYGATTILAKHVRVSGDTTTITFKGKGAKDHTIKVKDSRLAAAMSKRKGDLDPNSVMFDATAEETRQYIRRATGLKDVLNHDLRKAKATGMALALIKRKRGALPKSKTEYRKWKNEIGDAVSQQLGNTRAQALKSYIMNSIWDPWTQEGWD